VFVYVCMYKGQIQSLTKLKIVVEKSAKKLALILTHNVNSSLYLVFMVNFISSFAEDQEHDLEHVRQA